MRTWALAFAAALLGVTTASAQSSLEPPSTGGLVALDRLTRQIGVHKRVLVIGAHPDDEDTELLAWLARGQGAQAAYLSLNRGEGGQNSIGAELGDALGLLRTEELLAAREVDGARQFFTRAYDFGFSKTLDDTWAQWPRDTLLKDVVRVIRAFRPQIIVSVFSGTPRDGHGQHQAAGVLAREGFRLAGEASAFPELAQDEGLQPHAPLKLFRSARFDTAATTLEIEGGIVDPADGRSYHQLAMASRSRHYSQDMGRLQVIGASPIRLALLEDRTGAARSGTVSPFFQGIDTTLTASDVGALVRAEQQSLAARAAVVRAGLVLDAVADTDQLVAGDSVVVTTKLVGAAAAGAAVDMQLRTVGGLEAAPLGPTVVRDGGIERRFVVRVRASAAGQPYFLRRPRRAAIYDWPAPSDAPLGAPFDAPPISAVARVERAGAMALELQRDVTARENVRNAGGERRRPLVVVPRLSVDVGLEAIVRPAGEPVGALPVTVRNLGQRRWSGRVRLVREDGTAAASVPLQLNGASDSTILVAAPSLPERGEMQLTAQAVSADGSIADQAVREVRHAHVPRRAWLVPATVRVRAATLVRPSGEIGYVRGASDLVPEALRAAGIRVRELSTTAVERGDFTGLASVVIGPRAYETRPELGLAGTALQRFAEQGGTVFVQYQWPLFARSTLLPAPITMAADRVTEETAAVTLRDPSAPELSRPHRIGPDDWSGWVQERGLQFARSWGPAWRAPLELHDTGDAPRDGALLVTAVGRGRFIYSGLSFFRQLPAGVPGALRLFLNLASAPE